MDASRRSVADRPTTIAHEDERALQHRNSSSQFITNFTMRAALQQREIVREATLPVGRCGT